MADQTFKIYLVHESNVGDLDRLVEQHTSPVLKGTLTLPLPVEEEDDDPPTSHRQGDSRRWTDREVEFTTTLLHAKKCFLYRGSLL